MTKADTPRDAHGRTRWRRDEIEFVFSREFRVDDLLARFRAREEIRQAMIILRTDDEIDHRRAPHDLLPFGLRNAARHRDPHLAAVGGRGFLHFADAAELGIDLLGGLLADVAGIEDDEVGVFRPRGLDESLRRQGVRHTMRVVDVHLATVGLDVELARSAHAGRLCRSAGPSGRSLSATKPVDSGAPSHRMALSSGFSGKKECHRHKADLRHWVLKIASATVFFVVERDCVELEPVIDQAIAELARDLSLQPLDFLGLELDHLAGAQVDQMIVMRFRHLLVA